VFSINPKTLYCWYRNHLSDYLPDVRQGKWHPKYMEKVDEETGEVTKGNPLYVFKPENIGERMCIDDKSIGHEGFTILSNGHTSRIALMVESCKAREVSDAISLLGADLHKVKSISCDMAAGYLQVCAEQFAGAKVVIDKFHVMQYVYDAVLHVRTRIKKELSAHLSKGKDKTPQDRELLAKLDLLKHCRYRLTQPSGKWSEEGREVMKRVFACHADLEKAYLLSQSFRQWYDIHKKIKQRPLIVKELQEWYIQIKNSGLDECKSVAKMIRKHEFEIVNYFIAGHTNARAESLNGKINRFLSNSYGMKDKDFALYRTARYFS
jgi:transposase